MSWTTLPRTLVGELMDSPTLDEVEHRRALAGLRRINRISGTADALLEPIIHLAKRGEGTSRLTMLDVACGGGDVPVQVARAAKRHGLSIDLTLLDRSDVALAQAEATAKRAGVTVRTVAGDAVRALPAGTFDVVTNSLFLHHLTQEDATKVLRGMHGAARRMIVISDLRRSRPGLMLAWVACRALSRSPVVHFDGPASVRAAWTVEELGKMAQAAGLNERGAARVASRFPCRMLLQWENRTKEPP